MAALYDDVQPLLIQGYASVFNVVGYGSHPHRLLPGACDYVGLPVYACFGHSARQRFASVRHGSLRVWEDDYGVCFEAALPASWSGISLARGIRSGNFREVSCAWEGDRWSTFVHEDGERVEHIRRAKLLEISIVPAAACPRTGVWVDDEDPADLPPHIVQLRDMWHAGRQQAQPRRQPQPTRGPITAKARVRPPADGLARIDRIIALYRPRALGGRRW